MHTLLEQNAAMHSHLPIENVLILHYVLHAWRTVSNIAIARWTVTFGCDNLIGFYILFAVIHNHTRTLRVISVS